MIRSIILDGREIRYDFQRKRVKNINLRIKPDMSIYVSAPARTSLAEVESFMRLKRDFILGALDKFAARGVLPEPPQYENGDILRLLGRDYPLIVAESGRNSVSFDGNGMMLFVKDTADLELKRKTLDKWLKIQCREVIEESCGRIYPALEARGVKFPEIRIRTMKSKWGSCMPQKGVLTFNTNLIAAPRECVDYVVAHEFNHFLHPDHSAAFYADLAKLMPEWKILRQETNKHLIIRKG